MSDKFHQTENIDIAVLVTQTLEGLTREQIAHEVGGKFDNAHKKFSQNMSDRNSAKPQNLTMLDSEQMPEDIALANLLAEEARFNQELYSDLEAQRGRVGPPTIMAAIANALAKKISGQITNDDLINMGAKTSELDALHRRNTLLEKLSSESGFWVNTHLEQREELNSYLKAQLAQNGVDVDGSFSPLDELSKDWDSLSDAGQESLNLIKGDAKARDMMLGMAYSGDKMLDSYSELSQFAEKNREMLSKGLLRELDKEIFESGFIEKQSEKLSSLSDKLGMKESADKLRETLSQIVATLSNMFGFSSKLNRGM